MIARHVNPIESRRQTAQAALAVFGPEQIESAVGVELDSGFCDAARELWTEAGLNVAQGDFTRIVASSNRPVAPNLILANPPYVRHHHLEREDKERLQALVYRMAGVKVNGLAGLYVYFLLLATAWMEDGGYAAWLIPSEFMDVNYGAALKRYLTDCVTLIRAHRFDPDDVQFGDALVSSVVLVFRKMTPPPGHAVEFTFGGTIGEPHASDSIPLDQLRESRKWTVYPGHSQNDRRTSSDTDGSTLGDFFRVQRGIATGSNKFFVLDRRDAERRGLPKRYLRPILPSPRFLKTTVIDADEDGYPLIERQLCVIDCDLPEAVLRTRHPALWEYLGHSYRIVVSDLVRRRPIWFGGKDRSEASMDLFYQGLGPKKSRKIRVAVMDMWKPFRTSTLKPAHAPQAAVVFDKFHILRHLGEALDKVRKAEYARLRGKDRQFIKGQKYTLLSRREHLSLDGRKALKKLLATNHRLHIAYLLKESFGQLWSYQKEGWARRFFDNWRASLKWQRLKPYEQFAEMIERHWDGLANGSKIQMRNMLPC